MTKLQDTPTVLATVVATADQKGSLKSSTSRNCTPVFLPDQAPAAMDKSHIRQLQAQGFTRGLAEAMTQNNAALPLRIWVVDNSGSMENPDGNRIVTSHIRGS